MQSENVYHIGLALSCEHNSMELLISLIQSHEITTINMHLGLKSCLFPVTLP